jgi:L-fucose isomerase
MAPAEPITVAVYERTWRRMSTIEHGSEGDLRGSSRSRVDKLVPVLLFGKAGLAAAKMRDKSYLSIGSVSMGIAGSVVDASFFQNYLGMRSEYVAIR